MHFDKQYFLDRVVAHKGGNLRTGQFIFNEVHQLFPEEVNSITGTVYDCFYLDEKIDLFLEKMRQLVEYKEDASEGEEFKIFYRLGESIKNRKIRGGYNALS